MNWDAIGAVAEAVGAVGVVVTLVYLAAQIRSNTRSVRASTRQAMEGQALQVSLALAQDTDLSRIWSSGLLDFEALPREEKIRFTHIASVFLRQFEIAEYSSEQGSLDHASLERSRRQLGVVAGLPGFALWWEGNKHLEFSRPFEDLVGEIVARAKTPAAQQGAAAAEPQRV